MECRVFENFQKNISKFQKCPQLFPKVSKRVLNMFWGNFFEKFSPSFPWNVESSKIFKKNISKFQKCPQLFPKVSKRVLNMFWGKFFENFFCPVFRGGSSFRKFSKKIEKFSKFQKCPQLFPKVSKRVLNMFWGKFFEKFLPSFPWRVESSKISKKKRFQNSKNVQKCSQMYPNVF